MHNNKPLVLGNWKMNGKSVDNQTIINELLDTYTKLDTHKLNCGICPPSLYLAQLQQLLKDSPIHYGAQDVSNEEKGAYTGEISASMLADIGCKYVIVGHSERREYHHEQEASIAQKAEQAVKHGITPVYCVGEKLAHRESQQHEVIVKQQLKALCSSHTEVIKNTIIAYEPVWAIGTGKTATSEQAQEMHSFIRQTIAQQHPSFAQELSILYGGSVNENNAAELAAQQDINGFLVGGASLKPQSFIKICEVFS